MDQLSRVCVAAVAMVEGQSMKNSLGFRDRRLRIWLPSYSSSSSHDTFEDGGSFFGSNEEKNKRDEAEESLHKGILGMIVTHKLRFTRPFIVFCLLLSISYFPEEFIQLNIKGKLKK
ncbi:hypothetical protein CDL12_08758 [Handroanthus impetiginosus]|uniref:Uncharacterized protein n=1 Tax=Handroanthus impetiginosus TaxID=429701 RepID=A0A2G9HM20_9LAMI|nr:hypothetical protein CDL12_08758 [Handroanthus impetiginosus]